MKTNIGLLVGGLVLLLGSTASAGTITESCGSANSGNPSGSLNFNQFFTGDNGGGAAAGVSGSAVFTCSAFPIPAGQTLTSVSILVTDDADDPKSGTSQVQFVWSYSGTGLTPMPTGTFTATAASLASFANCSNSTGNLSCDGTSNFNLTSGWLVGPQTTGNYVLTVGATSTGGDAGVASAGDVTAGVFITFNYMPTTSVPEPTSLLMIGSGLIGLGVFARRKRK